MTDNLMTCLQLFGIGFSFGVIGPCFISCSPILVTYMAGVDSDMRGVLVNTLRFLSGRLAAYVILGLLAGISGAYINKLAGGAPYFKTAAGVISIAMGVTLLAERGGRGEKALCTGKKSFHGGFITLGFLIGISPCGPLTALLLQVSLMSHNAFDGALYLTCFGLGSFLSGLVFIAGFTGAVKMIPARLFRSERINTYFKKLCGLMMIVFGISLIWMNWR